MMDNLDAFHSHEDEAEKRESRYPCCNYCGKTIKEEHFYVIDGGFLCGDCLDELFRRNTEEYIEEDW